MCVHVCGCVHQSVFACVSVCGPPCTFVSACVHLYVYMFLYTCIFVYMYVCTYLYVCLYMSICMCMSVFMFLYLCFSACISVGRDIKESGGRKQTGEDINGYARFGHGWTLSTGLGRAKRMGRTGCQKPVWAVEVQKLLLRVCRYLVHSCAGTFRKASVALCQRNTGLPYQVTRQQPLC